MILAWLLHRRTRQATRPNSFSQRKPVVVRTRATRPPNEVAEPLAPLSCSAVAKRIVQPRLYVITDSERRPSVALRLSKFRPRAYDRYPFDSKCPGCR
jgi:hypothetical protein